MYLIGPVTLNCVVCTVVYKLDLVQDIELPAQSIGVNLTKQDGVAPLVADPLGCNSTTRQNLPIYQLFAVIM